MALYSGTWRTHTPGVVTLIFPSITSLKQSENAPGARKEDVRWLSCMHVPPISTGTSTTTPSPRGGNASGRSDARADRFAHEPWALADTGSADGDLQPCLPVKLVIPAMREFGS